MFPLPRGVIWLTLSLCLFSQPTTTHTSEGGRVVCYYTNWSVYRPGTAKFSPQNINPYLCTHLIYAFGGFTKDNTLKPFDKYQDIEQGGYAKFTGLKTYNKNLKTLLAIGGWNEASSRFSPLVANAERRAEFVRNILKFLRQNHFDGIDLDWEYPAFREGGKSRDRENYAKFVQELRAEFEKETSKTGRPRLLITMAVPAGVEYIEKGYDIPKLNKYLDWFNILSYDYHSAYEPSVNHHSPLYSLEEESEYNFDSDLNIDHTVKHYIKLGAQRDKLVLGMPTYGRSFTLFNEDSTDIGAPSDGPGEQGDATREKGYLAYYEICQNLKEDSDWTVVQPNPKAMGPYAFKLNQWVGYDDEAIARKKAEYVVEQGLGGIMFWSLDNDDFRGSCTGKPYPIIEAAKEALLESTGFGENEVIDKKLKQPARARSRNKSSSDRNKISNEVKSVRRQNANKRTTTTESSSLFIGGKSTTPPPPTTPDPGSDFKCKDEGFFQHPRDCKKYFWCLDSPNLGLVAHQFTCPSGLYFNPAADSCDFSRNVLCKKSQQATSTSTTTTAKPTTTTSSSRITAATSKNTYFRPSTTTTTTEEPYELEYEDEEETHVKGSEEDPMVIKELIDLIKKVGGIEELEKQLLQNEDGTMVLKNRNERDEKTTANPISKSLYDRVLSRSKSLNALQTRFKSNSFLRASHSPKTQEDYDENGEVLVESKPQDKYSSVIRNSRPGPQNEGLDQLAESEGFLREKPKYVTISRSHQKDEVVDESDNEKEETAEVVTKSSRFDNEKTVTHAYTNIRRSRPSTEKNVEEDYAENVEEEEEERTFDKRPYQSINRSRSNLDVTEAPFEASTAGRRYKVFSRNRVQRPQPDDEEFDDTSNVTVQDLEQIELTTQSSTQPTSRTYAVVGRRTTTTSTSATSTTLTDITNELQTTLSYNDNSNTPSTTASNPTTTSPTIQNTPSLLEISYSQDFDHSTHKPIALSTIESGLDTQEVTATTSQYNNIDDNYNNNNINNNSKQNTDTEEVTVAKTDNEKSSVDLKIDNNDNIKKHIDNIDISSNSSPLKNSIDSSSTSTTTSTPESIFIHKNNGDSAIKDSNIASEFSKSTTTTTSTETPSQSPTNNEFLGTVSSPRPFGFPRRRTRPIITTTATPDNSSQNSEHNHSNSLDQINRSNDNNKFSTKKSKFTRTRTLGSTINTTTNPTPIQVNNALDSENTSTPSSSRRFKVIKLRRPINNNMLINELNNNTSTSTTISQSDDRDRNINISISEVVDNKEKEDSEVHESLQVSELRRPFETLIEKSIRNEEDLVDEIIEIENSATNNNHTESSIINASSKDNSFQYNQSKKSVNASVLEGFEKNSMLTEVHTTEYKENMKTETTFEKIPESETAESNDESHTEISEPLLTKKPFIIKNTIKKLTNLKINENNLEESPVQSYTERQNRPFFPKRSTTVKPYSDETVSDSIVATEEHLVNPHTNRFKRPLIAKKMSATTPSLALLESSSESSDESILTKPGVLNNRTRRPFFPIRRTTTSSPIDIKSVEEEKEEVEKVQVDPQTPKFRKPIIGIRRASTTPKVELLGKTEKTIEEESSETLEVSARRSFLLAKKITSKSHSSGEIGSTKSIVPERVSIRKPFRRPGLSLRLTTEPPQKELYEDNDEVSTSTQRSRFALGGRRTFGSTTSDVDVSQTSTTEVNTSRQPRVFERKFGRTRTSLNTGTNIGLNNAGVGFIDVKTLSLASRGRSSAINRFKSTTEKAEEDISEEDDEDEESNEIINKRPLTIPSGFTRPTIKSNLFANRNKPNIRRPFQSTQKNENETASQDSESEDEEVEEPQRPQNISNLQRPTVRPNVVSFRNRAQAIRRPQPAESEEENISGESEENNDSKGSRLSNFNSKIYEKALPVVTKPTRRTVNNPYAAINRLRSNANNTSSSIRPSAQRPSNRPRVINRPLFGSSTQSSLDQEPSTQNPNSNTRTFKRKFGKFTTTVPSTQAYTKEEILVDALKINELTNIKHSTTTVNPTQLKTSVTETDNTAPTEDYDSTTVIATTLPDSTEDHTEMDEIMIPFQDDSLLKLDSTVDTTTISNEEETTLIDETLTQFQEIINSTASPVTTSTEKETTLQHVFAIPFDERAETTTELIDASTDAKNIAEKTQDIEDEVKKIINMLTGTGAIKPVMYEDVIKEDVVKDTDKTKKDNNEEVANTEKYDENQKVVLSENIEESEKVVTSGKMDIYEQDGLIKEQIEEHVLEKTPKVSDEVELEDKEETHIEEEISVENTNIHSKSNNESEAVSGNEKEITQKKPRTDLKDKIVDITEKIVTLSSSETTIPSSTESNLIKIITGQTIIFFDDDDDDENNFKYTDDFKQREKPILEKINLIDESKTNEENKTRLYSHNKFFTGKKFFPGFRSQENKSTLDTNTTPQSEVVKSIQDKMKSVQEESRSFSKNKIFTQEKNTYKFNKQKTSQPIIEGHYGEVESNEGLSRKESNSIEKQENILNHMIEEIKEVEMRNQEKMDEDNISDEEKKRLTAEKLVEINKIVEVYLKEEKIRFNPKTMEIIRLGEGELKLVRPARTYKLGEISRIKHVSNVQIEGHSSVAGTTISPPSYKQARNIRIVPSEPIRNALPSENNNHGKVFVIPEIVKQMETSTISIEGLFDLNRHGKELNTVYEPESETLTKATTADKPSLPIPLQYVRPLALESDPLVISIANLDQVVLSKLQKDRE
ncbi:Cht6 family protein [Megaselia abdita]